MAPRVKTEVSLQIDTVKQTTNEKTVYVKCPIPGCGGTIGFDTSHCPTCGSPIRACDQCHVFNRTEAHTCRGCKAKLDLKAPGECTGFDIATTVSLPRSSLRPRYHLGYYWCVTSEGTVYRVSPYAIGQPEPWHRLPDSSYGLTPFTIYPEDPSRMEEPCLIATGSEGVHAVSLLQPRQAKRLYESQKGTSLVRNQVEDEYFSVASWSR